MLFKRLWLLNRWHVCIFLCISSSYHCISFCLFNSHSLSPLCLVICLSNCLPVELAVIMLCLYRAYLLICNRHLPNEKSRWLSIWPICKIHSRYTTTLIFSIACKLCCRFDYLIPARIRKWSVGVHYVLF